MAMNDIAEWLKSLGLGKYLPTFQSHEIDLDSVQHLTEADLLEIGLPIGPRRKILAALQTPMPAAGDSPSAAAGVDVSERRHITVLFADIVGSTELSRRLDPEVLGDLLRTYQNVVSEQIRDFGGHLAKFMGDGVMAYFGWPTACEDAAERALRAGLGIIAEVTKIQGPTESPLQVRLGVASGVVVVGGLVGTGAAQEEAIAGETPNLAARLQGLASPNGLLISNDTYQLVGGLFECEAKGAFPLKGFSEPIAVWNVVSENTSASRFQSVRGQHFGFFGRKIDLDLFYARWEEAYSGKGYATIISGEAGIGKSRLVATLRERISSATHNEISWQCSPYHTNSALYPVVKYVEAAAAIVPADPPIEKTAKLEIFVAKLGIALDRAMPLFSELLSLPLDNRYQPVQGNPAQRKGALIAMLAEWIARAAEESPLLLVLEDAHWIDATTQELMTRLILAVSSMRVLIAVTARPVFGSPWSGRPRVGLITLDRLSEEDCERVVRSVAATRNLKPGMVDGILAKSDGNPLFLEELTETVLATKPNDSSAIPSTLQDSLMARLDAMGEAKKVAQVAAVIGRRFSQPLLAEIMEESPQVLDVTISQLIAAELVYPVGRINDATYEFKHALLHDAAYESLLRSRRRIIHGKIGLALETTFSKWVESEPELLAYHFGQADAAEKASIYGERSGDRGVAQFSYAEAIASYQGAIIENARLPESISRDQRELFLLLKLGPLLSVILGAQHPDVGAAYKRAADIATSLDDVKSLFQATWGLWYHSTIGRDLDTTRVYADELVALSERSQDDSHLLEALHSRWSTEMFRGESAFCAADAARGIERYDRARHHALGLMFGGHDPGVCAYGVCGLGKCMAGNTEEGRRLADAGISLAEDLNHPHSVAHGLLSCLVSYAIAEDRKGLGERAIRSIQLAEKYNFPVLLSVGTFFQSLALDDVNKRIAAMQSEYARVMRIGPMPFIYTALLSDELVLAGRAAEALPLLDAMLKNNRFPHTGLCLSEIYRVRGDCLAKLGGEYSEKAVEEIQTALQIARTQHSRLLELRASASLLDAAAGDQRRSAFASLRTLFGEFTEGLQSDTLIRARKLLESGLGEIH